MAELPSTFRSLYLLGPERLELRELPLPRPGPGEILVRIDAATTCGTDVKVYRRGGHPRMLRVPTPFGHEMAGTVAAAGPETTGRRIGERVVVANSAPCGACRSCAMGRENLCPDLVYLNGAFSEYLLVPPRFVERSVHAIPDGLASEVAALAEPLACVLHGLEVLGLAAEEGPPRGAGLDALVLGGGPIGLLFVAALAGLGHRVALADPHAARRAAGAALGAAAALEVSRSEPAAEDLRAAASDPLGFDLAIDATGSVEGWERAVGCVRPGGRVSLFGGCAPGTTLALDTHLVHYSELALFGAYHHRPATVAAAIRRLAAGAIDAGVLLTEERPLEEAEEALRGMIERRVLKAVVRPHPE